MVPTAGMGAAKATYDPTPRRVSTTKAIHERMIPPHY
jgi:hypothetical protein